MPKTEKTHFGTLVEVNLQRRFECGDGTKLGYRIAGPEPYPHNPVMPAVLSVARRNVRTIEVSETQMLVTECNRCRSGQDNAPIDMGDAVAAASGLSPGDRRRLLRWMERGR